MNKQIRTLLAFSAIGISTAAIPAVAGEFEPLHVSVPFAFTAGKTSLPAGDYTVFESGTHTVTIRGNRGSAIVLGSAGEELDHDKAELSFQHTEKGFYLKAVRSTGRPSSVLYPASETER